MRTRPCPIDRTPVVGPGGPTSRGQATIPTHFTCGPNRSIAALTYTPVGNPVSLAPDSLELFLTERYPLYTQSASTGQLYRGDIRHSPWTLRPADATVDATAFLTAGGLPAPAEPPVMLASSGTSTVVWWPEKV